MCSPQQCVHSEIEENTHCQMALGRAPSETDGGMLSSKQRRATSTNGWQEAKRVDGSAAETDDIRRKAI